MFSFTPPCDFWFHTDMNMNREQRASLDLSLKKATISMIVPPSRYSKPAMNDRRLWVTALSQNNKSWEGSQEAE